MSENILDLRGKEFSFDFPEKSIILNGGVKFMPLMVDCTVSANEAGTEVCFQKSFMESWNDDVAVVKFKVLAKDFPAVIVNPVDVPIRTVEDNHDTLAEVVLAQFGIITISRKYKKILFTLEFNGKTYYKIHSLNDKNSACGLKTMKHFFQFG